MNIAINAKMTGMSPQFLVADLNKSIEFYRAQLGFEVAFLYDDFYCGITRDGYSIHLKQADATAERGCRRTSGDLDITFTVEGIGYMYEDIKSRDVEIIQPLREMPYGTEFY